MVKFKTFAVKERAKLLHPMVIDVMVDMYQWCEDNNLPFEITETVTTLQEDLKLKRISASHRERRAFDLSSHGWRMEHITDFCRHYNTKYEDIAAIGKESLKPVLVQHHDNGNGPHFHVQIHSRFSFIAN